MEDQSSPKQRSSSPSVGNSKSVASLRSAAHIQSICRLGLAAFILMLAAGQYQVFGQKNGRMAAKPGSTPFSESFDEMLQRDQKNGIVPGAGEIQFGPPEREEEEVDFENPRGREFRAPDVTIDAPQTIGTSFQAVSFTQSGFIPPDTMGAIGPSHFVEMINGAVAIYNRSGVLQGSVVSLTSFFTVTIAATTYPRGGAFDPRIVYDRRSGRWFACALEFGVNSAQNGLVLAVSRTNNPTGIWDKYFLDVGAPGTAPNTFFTDYETLGVDDNGVYFAVRIFPNGAGTNRAKIIATGKASLIAASPALGTIYVTDNITDMYSTPQPVMNLDAAGSSTPQFFVASFNNSNICYRSLTWSAGVPTLSASSTLLATAAVGGQPIDAPAQGSTTNVDSGDFRLMMAIRKGGSLWTSRGILVNSTGGSTSGDRDACEWFQLGISGSTLSITQNGRVFDGSATPIHYYHPSIVVSGQGHATMAFSGSNINQFVASYFTGRLGSDPANTMGTVALLKAGEASYTLLDTIGRNRWGDYSYTSLDPNDDMTMWTLQEYASSPANNWSTRVAQLKAPPPAQPSSVNNPVTQGSSNVNVVVTGTSSSGSGFFDPGPDAGGPGFLNRIAASVGGTGVTVNSVTFTTPTQITLNLTIAANATLGARTVTVTNPDGQAATSASGILTVNSAPTPTSTATPSVGSISGTVTYANASAPPKFISNVTVTGSGSPNVLTTTAAPGGTAGQYTLTGFGAGSYTVSLSKTTGVNGINSFDAARVAQHVAGTGPGSFTTNAQRISADATNNGIINSFDAGKVAQYAAGLPLVAPNLSGTWRFFLPNPTFPLAAFPTTRTYASVSSNIAGDDYVGLLIGEVTGNWTPSAAKSTGNGPFAEGGVGMDSRVPVGPEKGIAVELLNSRIQAGKEVVLPVNVRSVSNKGVISYEFDLRYDPSVIQPLDSPVDVTKTVSRGLMVVTNPYEPGLLRVVVYGALPIDKDGVLLNLRFTAVGAAGSVSSLSFERIMFNDDEPMFSVSGGYVELF